MDTDPNCTHLAITSMPKKLSQSSKHCSKKFKSKDHIPPNPAIDLDQLSDSQPSMNGKLWRPVYIPWPTQTELSCWAHAVRWLNDNLIVAVQNLLKKQSSIPGFQDTYLGQSMGFKIQWGEFIQILHDGHGHWLMISGAITRTEYGARYMCITALGQY